jgi:hypothetical protein
VYDFCLAYASLTRDSPDCRRFPTHAPVVSIDQAQAGPQRAGRRTARSVIRPGNPRARHRRHALIERWTGYAMHPWGTPQTLVLNGLPPYSQIPHSGRVVGRAEEGALLKLATEDGIRGCADLRASKTSATLAKWVGPCVDSHTTRMAESAHMADLRAHGGPMKCRDREKLGKDRHKIATTASVVPGGRWPRAGSAANSCPEDRSGEARS